MYEITSNLSLGLNGTGPGWALYRPRKNRAWEPYKWYAKPEQALDDIAEHLCKAGESRTSGELDGLIAKVQKAASMISDIRKGLAQ